MIRALATAALLLLLPLPATAGPAAETYAALVAGAYGRAEDDPLALLAAGRALAHLGLSELAEDALLEARIAARGAADLLADIDAAGAIAAAPASAVAEITLAPGERRVFTAAPETEAALLATEGPAVRLTLMSEDGTALCTAGAPAGRGTCAAAGQSTQLVLENPGATPARLRLIWAPAGALDPAPGEGGAR